MIKALFSYQIEILKGSTDSLWTLVGGFTAYPKSPVCKAPKFITLHCSSSQNEGKNSIFCKRLRLIPDTRYLSSYLYYLYLFIYLYKTRHLYFLRVVFQVLPTRSKIWKKQKLISKKIYYNYYKYLVFICKYIYWKKQKFIPKEKYIINTIY